MTPSLSVILPVCNSEDRLALQVDELLDVLPELSDRFEVLIVDDGSTDDTAHVATDLARCFPQVRVVSHPVTLGLTEAIQTGLDNTAGEIVLVGDVHYGIPTNDLHKLWQLRHEEDLVVARKPAVREQSDRRLLDRLLSWTPGSQRAARPTPAVHVLRRGMLQSLRIDQVPPSPPLRPNFLDKVKAFAMGE